jgi:hypothetical protein
VQADRQSALIACLLRLRNVHSVQM